MWKTLWKSPAAGRETQTCQGLAETNSFPQGLLKTQRTPQAPLPVIPNALSVSS